MEIVLNVNVVKVGRRYLALTKIGGFEVEGEPAGDPVAAYKKMLWKLSGNGAQDTRAELGVELLVQGTDLQSEVQRQKDEERAAITDGRDPQDPFAGPHAPGTND